MSYVAAIGDAIGTEFTAEYSPFCGACLDVRLGDEPQVCGIWRPASGNSIDIEMSSGYVVPGATAVDVSFDTICYPVYVSVILPCDEIRPYSIPAGNNLVIELYREYVPPVGNAITIELVDCAGDVPPVPPPPWYQIPSGLSAGIATPFGSGISVEKAVESVWGTPRYVDARLGIQFGSGDVVERLIGAGWRDLGQLYRDNRSAWGRLLAFDRDVQSVWYSLFGRDVGLTSKFSEADGVDEGVELPWLAPPEKDIGLGCAFDCADERDAEAFSVPWGAPPPKDILHETCWGPTYYAEICTRDYVPPLGNALDFDLDQPINEVGDKDHVDVWFDSLSYDQRCNQREPSGWRDAYTYGGWDFIPAGAIRRVYVLNNLASVTRVADSAPIEVTSVTMATDMDSWGWTVSATPGSAAALALLDPKDGAVEIEAQINGFSVAAQIDSWSHGRRFLGDGRQAGGRSLSATLAAPTAATKTYIEGSARTAQQIAADALLYSGWVLDWQLTDWLIPAGLFSASEQTPLQIIKAIAEAGDGYVQTHPSTKTLIVAPRFKVMPWDFATATIDVIVPEEMMDTIDGEWLERPAYNAAFVSGTVTGGISMKLTRSGTAGDFAAPMVTDPLLCATEVCTARGKGILARGGKWRKMRCSFPVMTAPAVPGVLLPGTLLSVTGVDPFVGIVSSVAVTASWGRALVVRQVIELERYYGS